MQKIRLAGPPAVFFMNRLLVIAGIISNASFLQGVIIDSPDQHPRLSRRYAARDALRLYNNRL